MGLIMYNPAGTNDIVCYDCSRQRPGLMHLADLGYDYEHCDACGETVYAQRGIPAWAVED